MVSVKKRYKYRTLKERRQCVVCAKKIRTHSRSRKYCSGACKTWAVRWRQEQIGVNGDVYDCTNCGAEQESSQFDRDLVEAAGVECLEEISLGNVVPQWALNEAVGDFGGKTISLCAKCRWACEEAAWELADKAKSE